MKASMNAQIVREQAADREEEQTPIAEPEDPPPTSYQEWSALVFGKSEGDWG